MSVIEHLTTEIPGPRDLLWLREDILMLSQTELAGAIGFAPGGAKTIRSWEDGERDGQPFRPTPTAWAAFRYLVILTMIFRDRHGPADLSMQKNLANLLPECVK